MVVKEKVQLIVETILKGQEKFKEMTQRFSRMRDEFNTVSNNVVSSANKQGVSIDALARKNEFLRFHAKRLGTTTDQVKKSMAAIDVEFNKVGEAVGKAGQKIQVTNATMNRGRAISKGFQFQWLGVMFAGMALNRVFGGLIQSQMQLFGVSDLLSAAWTVVLLPVMEILLPILFKMLDVFMNMSPSMKLAVGIFVVMGAVLGIILSVVGQIMLGVASMAVVFSISAGVIGAVVGGVLLILAGVSFLISGIITIVQNWGKNWGQVVDGVVKVLLGLGLVLAGIAIIIGSIPIAIAAAIALVIAGVIFVIKKIKDNWTSIKTFFKNLWTSIKGIFRKGWNFIAGLADKILPRWMIKLLSGGFNVVRGVGSRIKGLLGFQTGGVVPGRLGAPQLAVVHGGERITPPGGNGLGQGINFQPNVTINANVSSNFDVRQIAEELNRIWASDFERLTRTRSL